MSTTDLPSPRFCAATRQAQANLVAALGSMYSGNVRTEHADTIRMFRNAYLADEKADGVDKETASANADALIAEMIDGSAGRT